MSSLNEKLLPEVLSGLEAMTAIRRDLHAHPELGMCEVRTAKIAADAFRAMGCDEVVEGIGKTGVAAVIRGASEIPGILSRSRFAPTWTRCRSKNIRGIPGLRSSKTACTPAGTTVT